ncbi:MAG: Fic family protein [Sphingobacteriales bacterium]|jgi:Fic family protein|nr:MAG: Fic family protein [Sphingobacteriales bacterium]
MSLAKTDIENKILGYLKNNPSSTSIQIFENIAHSLSFATIKRLLQKNITAKNIEVTGKGKSTRYHISFQYQFLNTVNVNDYFKQEIDERNILASFNIHICEFLANVQLFSASEIEKLNGLQAAFLQNAKNLNPAQYQNELERLAIDLSWKSSQIEGNTYSLLETERLLKDKLEAVGKTKEEAIMLLNHKYAIDFVLENTNYLSNLSVAKLEEIHSLLIKNLAIDSNIRKTRVGITGTNYKPLDNEFQIREALEAMCNLINIKTNVFEKALLCLVLLSYIQAFNDGNKRTARIVSNAILLSYNYCPISFRTVDTIEYKKAMLIFYEQNNLQPFKAIFITQFEFAVNTYF